MPHVVRVVSRVLVISSNKTATNLRAKPKFLVFFLPQINNNSFLMISLFICKRETHLWFVSHLLVQLLLIISNY